MAFPATSSLRSLRSVATTASRSYATIQPYSPPSRDYAPPRRSPRPDSPQFFTGRPQFHEALATLSSTVTQTTSVLRKAHIYPLPDGLPTITPPRASWVSPEELSSIFQTKLKTSTLRQVMDLLSELHNLRHISDLSGYPDLAGKIDKELARYERLSEEVKSGEEKESRKKKTVDEFGRAYGMGRKKTSSARVWAIPTPSALPILESTSSSSAPSEAAPSLNIPKPEILINHQPLHTYFPRLADREAVLRPLRLTGLLGAYNVFAFSRGGGVSGQAGAVALGLARALSVLKEDAVDVLRADGALMRDPRMVERKKTGRAKARKGYTWVKR
ncbi:hypothetical protein L198_07528 [Cryptococcus wingfieldii CBS 7118]|uniref:Uncharacterized protein n=1 Tax=Cryptococcus wingfieldii CBS 7118 TaxID=1295528 RepID=A0A1E3IA41_9TREE|nr:hypothetical protein L198_07528 [Cryptococcus wingfieldii CBS 7118]ODN85447.1 hypothetical protein L198_07528 [Cryptococcus wingfieldii CBS 7118]